MLLGVVVVILVQTWQRLAHQLLYCFLEARRRRYRAAADLRANPGSEDREIDVKKGNRDERETKMQRVQMAGSNEVRDSKVTEGSKQVEMVGQVPCPAPIHGAAIMDPTGPPMAASRKQAWSGSDTVSSALWSHGLRNGRDREFNQTASRLLEA
ncbi:uncharacterized protein CIMG_00086 [Coccidioides immitis RS]|uniref:Uncharacterized protein n=1 Tax=Coccidioides immitis (strain RS) TaxID=246410 RepID=J3KG88_COCIM|nr:uncharacterized protein CIMG_00086 [Coccidioides immitis RS]EAS34732.3 hypothetical protein CIMG_00086 [Coccidioides immitis RS]